MTTRPWQEIVTELVSTGLTQQQVTLLLSLVSAMSTGLSGGSPLGSADGATEFQREKWRNQKQKWRNKQKQMSAQLSTGLSAGQADIAPTITEVVLGKEGNRKEELLLPELVEGQKPKRTVSRGTRLPENWQPSDQDFKFAADHGLRLFEIDLEALKFRNYWTNRTDRQASKPRWDRAWQNWILNVKGSRNGHAKTTLTDLAAELADEARELERQAGIGRSDGSFGGH